MFKIIQNDIINVIFNKITLITVCLKYDLSDT